MEESEERGREEGGREEMVERRRTSSVPVSSNPQPLEVCMEDSREEGREGGREGGEESI